MLRQLTEPSRDRPLPLDGAPLIPPYEPSEDWWYCYIDDVAFVVDGAPSFERARPVATAATHVGRRHRNFTAAHGGAERRADRA